LFLRVAKLVGQDDIRRSGNEASHQDEDQQEGELFGRRGQGWGGVHEGKLARVVRRRKQFLRGRGGLFLDGSGGRDLELSFPFDCLMV
jgi:hypothetical protein